MFSGRARAQQALETLRTLLPLQKEARAGGTAQLQAEVEARKAQTAHLGELRNFMTLFREDNKDYFSQSEEVQTAIRPGRLKVWQMAGKALGLDPQDIEAGFTFPDFADRAMAVVDPIVQNSPALAAYAKQLWAGAKPGEERRKAAEEIDTRARAVADGMIRQALPQMLQSAGRGPLNPVSPEELRQAFTNLPGEYSKSLILQEQFDAFLNDPKNEVALQRIGVETGAVAAAAKKAGAVKAAEVKAEGPPLPRETSGELATMPNAAGAPLTPGQATPAQIAAAGQQAQAKAVEQRAKTGYEAALVQRRLPLTPAERSKLANVEQLERSLALVQPPHGTSLDTLTGDFVEVSDKQKGQISGLKKTRIILDQLFTLADRAITAKTPEQALAQRGTGPLEAWLKTKPVAAAYNDARTAFLGNLSRELGSERGVLTENDIQRIANGLPGFSDTITTREMKKAIVNDLWDAARQATVGEISGRVQPTVRTRINELLDKLDHLNGPRIKSAKPIR